MINSIEKILENSLNAPSGDNSQPWKFDIQEDKVDVFMDPNADNKILNYKLRGTLLAHGALVENIRISATSNGYNINVEICDDYIKTNRITRIKFFQKDTIVDPLINSLADRSTNRNKYSSRPLSGTVLTQLNNSAFSNTKVSLVTNDNVIKELSDILSTAEFIVLNNRALHNLLFGDLVWNMETAKKVKKGLYVSTLELALPAKMIMRLAKNWNAMKILKKLGLPKLVALGNSKVYEASGAIGAIIVRGDSHVDYINAGRTLEKLWLNATSEIMGFQPLNGLLFLGMNSSNLSRILPTSDIETVNSSFNKFSKIFKLGKGEQIATIFRTGYQIKPPSARSLKFNLSELMLR